MQRTVKLSGQPVEIRPLSWSGWKRVRAALAQTLARETLPRLLADVLRMQPEAFESLTGAKPPVLTGGEAQRLVGSVAELAGRAAVELSDALDALTDLLIAECASHQPDGEDVPAADVIRLRDAVVEVADVRGLLAAEKNSLLAALGTTARTTTASAGNGTPSPSPEPSSSRAS